MNDIWFFEQFMPLLFFFFTGIIFGSFASAVAYRMPRGISFVTGRSACPSCGHTLNVADLFPLASWLVQGGSCRYCGARFGLRYLLIELSMGLAFAGIFYMHGLHINTLALCIFVFLLVLQLVMALEDKVISLIVLMLLALGGFIYQELLFAEEMPLLINAILISLLYGVIARIKRDQKHTNVSVRQQHYLALDKLSVVAMLISVLLWLKLSLFLPFLLLFSMLGIGLILLGGFHGERGRVAMIALGMSGVVTVIFSTEIEKWLLS